MIEEKDNKENKCLFYTGKDLLDFNRFSFTPRCHSELNINQMTVHVDGMAMCPFTPQMHHLMSLMIFFLILRVGKAQDRWLKNVLYTFLKS